MVSNEAAISLISVWMEVKKKEPTGPQLPVRHRLIAWLFNRWPQQVTESPFLVELEYLGGQPTGWWRYRHLRVNGQRPEYHFWTGERRYST